MRRLHRSPVLARGARGEHNRARGREQGRRQRHPKTWTQAFAGVAQVEMACFFITATRTRVRGLLLSPDYSAYRAALSPKVTKLRSSASSWQGPVVVPGGAPAPPECRLCMPARGHRTSSRLTTPRETTLQRTRWMRDRGSLASGDGLHASQTDRPCLGSVTTSHRRGRRPLASPYSAARRGTKSSRRPLRPWASDRNPPSASRRGWPACP